MRDESLPPEPLPLTEASVQEIQLELIRRRRFNEFDGKKIVGSLRRHRKLWEAVVFDAHGISDEGSGVGGLNLIKLRDLSSNYWNVDTLFILCREIGDARQLTEIAEAEDWKADSMHIHQNSNDLSLALGTSDPGIVVEFWWD
jgi:hypothetical protein